MNNKVTAAITKMLFSNDADMVADAAAIQCLKLVETSRVSTAATDGVVILYNPAFVESLSVEEVIGLLVHEVLHVRFRHTERMLSGEYLDARAANKAMDREINPIVRDAGYALPPDGCWPSELGLTEGLPWEGYYHHEAKATDESEPEDGDDEDESEGEDETGDTGEGSGEDTGGDTGEGEGEGSGSGSGGGTANGVHGAGSLVEEYAPELVEEMTAEEVREAIQKIVEDVAERIAEAQANAGSGKGIGTETAEVELEHTGELVTPEAGTRWQDVVIDMLGERRGGTRETDWTRRGRRSFGEVYVPGSRRRNGYKLALVVDVSGSCVQHFSRWSSFARELVEEIGSLTELEIIYHDTKIKSQDTWQRASGDEPTIASRGGGGTDFRPALAEVEGLDVDGIIMFTDCCGPYPSKAPAVPVVTVLPPGETEVAPFGKTVATR